MLGHGPTDMGQEVRETHREPHTNGRRSALVRQSRWRSTLARWDDEDNGWRARGSSLQGSVACLARRFGREPRSSGQEWLRADNGVGGPWMKDALSDRSASSSGGCTRPSSG